MIQLQNCPDMHIKVKGFQIFKDRHGKARCYHRASGTSIDLVKFPIGSIEFFGECSRISALNVVQETKPGSWGELVKKYKAGGDYEALQPATCKWYEDAFEYLRPINDTLLIRFDTPLIMRIRDKAQKKSWYFGNKVKTSMSAVFAWGLVRGYVGLNPASGIKKISRPKDLPKMNRPWSDKERFTVIDALPWHMKVPVALMMYTGMDPCDAVRLRKNQYDGHAIEYARQKTGNPVWKPVPEALKIILQNGLKHDAITICANSYGNPWTTSGLNSNWTKIKADMEEEELIAPGLTLKGLRHTKATLLREQGEDSRTVADVLAQETEVMGWEYSKTADVSKKLAGVTQRFDVLEREKRAAFVKPQKKAVKP